MDFKSNYLTQKCKLKQQEDISLDFSSWPSLESWVSEVDEDIGIKTLWH